MLNLLAHVPKVLTSLTVIVTIPEQLSVADTAAVEAAGTSLAQLTLSAGGVPVITGAVISRIVIVCVAEVAFPQASVTVHFLVITLLLGHKLAGVKHTL